MRHNYDKDIEKSLIYDDGQIKYWVDLFQELELIYGQFEHSPNIDLKVFPWWLRVVSVSN